MKIRNKKYTIQNTRHSPDSRISRHAKHKQQKRKAALLGAITGLVVIGFVSGSLFALDILSKQDVDTSTQLQDSLSSQTEIADTGNSSDTSKTTEKNNKTIQDDETSNSDTSTPSTQDSSANSGTAGSSNVIANETANKAVAKSSYPNPFSGRSIYVGSHDPAGTTANQWATSNPSSAAALRKISGQPIAIWLTQGISNLSSYVSSNTAAASAQGAVPVFVVYGMPGLSCDQTNAGAESYISWVESITNAVQGRRAIYIVEPDELAIEQCAGAESNRNAVLKQSVQILASNSNAAIYIDAGHGRWVSSSIMASRLRDSGIEYAQGFALNVSNYETTAINTSYGNTLSGLLGGVHYVIDTSRNGNGPTADNEWCNAPGRALGEKPRASSGLLDAYLWIKYPGESDLACNGGPAEGQWWPEYAVGLAERAAW